MIDEDEDADAQRPSTPPIPDGKFFSAAPLASDIFFFLLEGKFFFRIETATPIILTTANTYNKKANKNDCATAAATGSAH